MPENSKDGRKLSHDVLEAIRLRVVEQMLRGESPEALSRALGFNAKTLYRWRELYEKDGWDGLKAKAATGRPPSLTGDQQDWLARRFGKTGGTPEQVVMVTKRNLGIEISEMTARRMAEKLGIEVSAKGTKRNGKGARIRIPLNRIGSKFRSAPWIVSFFPKHKVYVEPFAGTCAVLFEKRRSEVEIINDADERLINVFRHIQKNPEKLAAILQVTPYSEAFSELRGKSGSLQDAGYYMAKCAQEFVGGGRYWSPDKSNTRGRVATWNRWFERIAPAAQRLKGVQIMSTDGVNAIRRVADVEDALIFCDPPYAGYDKFYDHQVDREAMAEALRACRGKVIVSGYEPDEELFRGWYKRARLVSPRGRGRRLELLFATFPLRSKTG